MDRRGFLTRVSVPVGASLAGCLFDNRPPYPQSTLKVDNESPTEETLDVVKRWHDREEALSVTVTGNASRMIPEFFPEPGEYELQASTDDGRKATGQYESYGRAEDDVGGQWVTLEVYTNRLFFSASHE